MKKLIIVILLSTFLVGCGSQDYVRFETDDPFIIGTVIKDDDGVTYYKSHFEVSLSTAWSLRKAHVFSDVDLGYNVGDTLNLQIKTK